MSFFGQLIDIIYPPRCAICNRFLWRGPLVREPLSPFFCPDCLAGFHPLASPMCPICSQPFSTAEGEDHVCEECLRRRPSYEALWACYCYEGAVLEGIQRLKYGKKGLLADALGPILARFAAERITQSRGHLIMPVPLHPRRLRERGFNQSLVLARHVAKTLRMDLDFSCLRRIRYTLPQASLAKKDRHHNVRGAFEVRDPGRIKGKSLIIVDDVVTTGSTLNECARVLKRYGAAEVFGLSLARTGR